MEQDNARKYRQIAKLVIGVVTICSLIFLGLRHLDSVYQHFLWVLNLLTPLLIGVALALVLNVPMRLIERHLFRRSKNPSVHKLRRPLAILLSSLLIFGIVFAVASLIIPELIEAIKIFSANLMSGIDYLEQLEINTGNISRPIDELLSTIQIDWEQVKLAIQEWMASSSGNLFSTVFSAAGSVVGSLINSFIGFIFAVYILQNKETLKRQVSRLIQAWLPDWFGNGLVHVVTVWNHTFQNFIVGQTTEAIILGSLCAVGMIILGLPYAPMIGALVSVTAFIPIVGAFIGTIVGAFMILSVNPMQALLFVLYLLILQQIEGNLIYPKVMGTKIQLPSMWVLAAVTLGGGIAGAIGMLLAVPTTAAVYSLVREATARRLEAG